MLDTSSDSYNEFSDSPAIKQLILPALKPIGIKEFSIKNMLGHSMDEFFRSSPIILDPPCAENKGFDAANRQVWNLLSELTTVIFQFTDIKTICNLMQVCRLFLEVANHEDIRSRLYIEKNQTIYKKSTIFPPHENLLQKIYNDPSFNFFKTNTNTISLNDLNIKKPQYEQPGDGNNGFTFTPGNGI